MKLKYEIMACIDCLLYVANGETPDADYAIDAVIRAHLGSVDAANLVCGDGDKENEFSWRACECCGSTLGGSRHHLAVLECE